MSIENFVMTLNRIPKIEVDAGTDWTAVWTALGTSLATITVVLVTTIYTAYSFRKTIRAQKDLANAQDASRIAHSKAEAIARSRQEWINDLRDAVAQLLASGNEISAASEKLHNRTNIAPESQGDVMKVQDLYDGLYSDFTHSLTNARLHFAKVQLYTNPSEEETVRLILAMNKYIDASSNRQPSADLGNAVVGAAQTIIKKEWIRVKAMNS